MKWRTLSSPISPRIALYHTSSDSGCCCPKWFSWAPCITVSIIPDCRVNVAINYLWNMHFLESWLLVFRFYFQLCGGGRDIELMHLNHDTAEEWANNSEQKYLGCMHHIIWTEGFCAWLERSFCGLSLEFLLVCSFLSGRSGQKLFCIVKSAIWPGDWA